MPSGMGPCAKCRAGRCPYHRKGMIPYNRLDRIKVGRTRRAVARRRLNDSIESAMHGGLPGRSASIMASAPKVRGRRYVRIGVVATRAGIYHDPAKSVAWHLRNALAAPPIPPAIIYDAAGTAVATMDAVTRVRTPLPMVKRRP